MVFFYSYVSLPEGNLSFFKLLMVMTDDHPMEVGSIIPKKGRHIPKKHRYFWHFSAMNIQESSYGFVWKCWVYAQWNSHLKTG